MPLTAKGREIKSAMTKQYGEEKGESVFYASKNKGTITGVDSVTKLDAILAKADAFNAKLGREYAPDGKKDDFHTTYASGKI